MRFRLSELLIVGSVAGFACASLVRSDPLFEMLFFSATLLFTLVAVLLAVALCGERRVFWTGFAIASVSYLLFAHLPDRYNTVPRHNGPEFTTRILAQAYTSLHAPPAWVGGMLSVDVQTGESGSSEDPFSPGQDDGLVVDDDDPFSDAEDDRLFGDDEDPFSDGVSSASQETHSGSYCIVCGATSYDSSTKSVSFMRVGHGSWALFLGWLGGHLTKAVYVRSRRRAAG